MYEEDVRVHRPFLFIEYFWFAPSVFRDILHAK